MDVATWVNDRLHDVLGMSDRTLAEFFIGLGKRSSSSGRFIEELRKTGAVEVDQKIESFCEELWDRLPRSSNRPVFRESAVAESVLLKKNQSYKMVDSDEESPPVVRNIFLRVRPTTHKPNKLFL